MFTDRRLIAVLTLVALALTSIVGCESKFNEAAPGTVSADGMTLEQRIAAKDQIESRFEQIRRSANQVKSVLDTFRLEQTTHMGQSYTPIDFLLDMNAALSKKIPESQNLNGEQSRDLLFTSTIQLPTDATSPECRTVETQLHVNLTGDIQHSASTASSSFQYFVKTCQSGDQFLPLVSANWSLHALQFGFNNNNFQSIFHNALKAKIAQQGACSTSLSDSGILQSISCQDMQVGLSSSEFSIIRNLSFSNSGDDRFSVLADVYDRGAASPKGTATLSMSRSGHVTFDMHKNNDPVGDDSSESTYETQPGPSDVEPQIQASNNADSATKP